VKSFVAADPRAPHAGAGGALSRVINVRISVEQGSRRAGPAGGVGVPEGVRRRRPVALDEIRRAEAVAIDRCRNSSAMPTPALTQKYAKLDPRRVADEVAAIFDNLNSERAA